MNYIKWIQIGAASFYSEDENFNIVPVQNGNWRLVSKQKDKFYIYQSLQSAFEAARNIADFFRNPELSPNSPDYIAHGRYAKAKGK